jgi:hypothetical protein
MPTPTEPPRAAAASAPHRPISDAVSHAHVRDSCARLVEDVASLHREVTIAGTGVDIRAEFRGRLLCRVVPYRELLHVHVGDGPTWEARVRNESDYVSVVDAVVRAFRRMASR